jgi:hypothetical protein
MTNSRRRLIGLAFMLLLACAALAPARAEELPAKDGVIKVGILHSLSGTMAVSGRRS